MSMTGLVLNYIRYLIRGFIPRGFQPFARVIATIINEHINKPTKKKLIRATKTKKKKLQLGSIHFKQKKILHRTRPLVERDSLSPLVGLAHHRTRRERKENTASGRQTWAVGGLSVAPGPTPRRCTRTPVFASGVVDLVVGVGLVSRSLAQERTGLERATLHDTRGRS